MDATAAGRARRQRLEAILTELRRRIRPVCRTMPDDLFQELIETMGQIQLKYEVRTVAG